MRAILFYTSYYLINYYRCIYKSTVKSDSFNLSCPFVLCQHGTDGFLLKIGQNEDII